LHGNSSLRRCHFVVPFAPEHTPVVFPISLMIIRPSSVLRIAGTLIERWRARQVPSTLISVEENKENACESLLVSRNPPSALCGMLKIHHQKRPPIGV
jgi:hypothetical protein